jgi:PPK2 family polyphosphate:nucleotide phosphotransferase
MVGECVFGLSSSQMQVGRFRIRHGDRAALTRHRPDDKGHFESKDAALQHLQKSIDRLRSRQALLYAQNEYALLLIFQGMDASGKDSAIKRVMSGVNPQGTEVHSFQAPSTEELSHDYLWRAVKALPGRGRIGIFNRSYYEEVLVVRVHPALLASERLPASCVTPRVWRERFEDISEFERYLSRNGTIIRKFFLYVSRAEQRRRLLARLDDPAKNWKFSAADVQERAKWNAHMSAYRNALAATSHDNAPWYVIPADHKWFAHVVIADIIVKALDGADLSFPKLTLRQRRELLQARRQLVRER